MIVGVVKPSCMNCGCEHFIPARRHAFKNTTRVLLCRHCGRKWHEPIGDRIRKRGRKKRDEYDD